LKKKDAILIDSAEMNQIINNKDWREIFAIKSIKKLEHVLKFLKDMRRHDIAQLGLLKDPVSRKKLSERLSYHQIGIFFSNELLRYRKRYPKSNYFQDVNEAQTNNSKLFRIIRWDKAWIYAEWVKKKVIDAQEDHDLNFLKGLGEAIASRPQSRKLVAPQKSSGKKDREFILNFMECYVAAAVTKYPQTEVYERIKEVYEKLALSEVLPDELRGFDYFMRYLRRHDVIL